MTNASPEAGLPNSLAKDEIEEIRARCSATTPGPWQSYVEGRDHDSGSNFIMTQGDDLYLIGGSVADQEFVAHAKQDIPRLLMEVERLTELVQKQK
jgi:hypothetical protein